tara:strand:+ start:162 stop:842 length:681 start_codon:yes stop_codon:yes gene_type:complete
MDAKSEDPMHWTDQDVRPRDISIRFLGLDTIADVYEKVKALKDKLMKEEGQVLRLKKELAEYKKKLVMKDDAIRTLQEEHGRTVKQLRLELERKDGDYLMMTKDDLENTRFFTGLLTLLGHVKGFANRSMVAMTGPRTARIQTVRYLLSTVNAVSNALTNILLNLTEDVEDRAKEYKVSHHDNEGDGIIEEPNRPWFVTLWNFLRTGRCYSDDPLEDVIHRPHGRA